MARSKRRRLTVKEAGGITGWLTATLLPYLGPPPLGDRNEPQAPSSVDNPCPLCGAPMSEHRVDRSGERTQLYCPTAPTP